MKIKQALETLGGDFAKCTTNKNRAYSSREDGGLTICFRDAKMDGDNLWRTSESPLTVDGCTHVVLALQHLGVVAIPREVVLYSYWGNLNVPTKGGRRNILIKIEDNRVVLYNRPGQEVIDITKYMHPFEVNG